MPDQRTRRECATCHETKGFRSFYSKSPDCIACTKLKRAGQLPEPGSVEEVVQLKRVAEAAREREKLMIRRAVAEKQKYREKRAMLNAADAELAGRIVARRNLLAFVTKFHHKYDPGWVHKDICRRLERFSQAVADKKSPRLLLLMPPRHGKSEIASRKFPAWHLGRFPDHEIIATSHSSSLALGFSRTVRELIRSPVYKPIFPDTSLDAESQALEQWRTTAGGGYTAAGVGTGITGMGAHVLIVDDPVKDMEAADSPTIRDATWEWYLSTAYSRLAPGGGVLGIQTWWNDDDWAGRIQLAMESGDGEEFEVVKYPAINEGYDEYLGDDDRIIQVAPGFAAPEKAVLLRPADSALHPARYTYEYLQQVKKNYRALGQTRIWSALYQQNPAPEEGAYFTKDMMQYYTHEPLRFNRHVYQAWDFAIGAKRSNDWIVCCTLLQDEFDDLYELDLLRFKSGDTFVIVDAILDQYMKFNPNFLGFEDGQIWKSLKAVFLRRCQERKIFPSFEELAPYTDKLVRAEPLKGRMQHKKVKFRKDAPYQTIADSEMLRFPAAKHDDIVDARAWAVRLSLAHPPPRPRNKTQKLESWRDKVKNLMSAEGSFMSA